MGLQKFFPPTQSPLVFVARSCAVLSSGTGTLWLGVGLGLLTLKISLPNLYPPHVGEGPTHSASVSLLPVWMDVVSLIL